MPSLENKFYFVAIEKSMGDDVLEVCRYYCGMDFNRAEAAYIGCVAKVKKIRQEAPRIEYRALIERMTRECADEWCKTSVACTL